MWLKCGDRQAIATPQGKFEYAFEDEMAEYRGRGESSSAGSMILRRFAAPPATRPLLSRRQAVQRRQARGR
jgi:hypothetical protein